MHNYFIIRSRSDLNSNILENSNFKFNKKKNEAYDLLKTSNQRLKFLELIEKDRNKNLVKGIENINKMKLKRQEDKIKKEILKKDEFNRISKINNKIKYLYKNKIEEIDSNYYENTLKLNYFSDFKNNSVKKTLKWLKNSYNHQLGQDFKSNKYKSTIISTGEKFEINHLQRKDNSSNRSFDFDRLENMDDYEKYLKNSFNEITIKQI